MYITQDLLNNFIEIERLLCTIEKQKLPYTTARKYKNQAATEDLLALLQISGIRTNSKQLQKLRREITPLSSDKIHKLIKNFDNVNRLILSLPSINLSVVQQIHKTFTSNLLDYWDLGRLRNKEENPDYSLENIETLKIPKHLKDPDELFNLLNQINNKFWLVKIFIWLNTYPHIMPFAGYNISVMLLTAKALATTGQPNALHFVSHIKIGLQYLTSNKTKFQDDKLEFLTHLYLEEIRNLSRLVKYKTQKQDNIQIQLNKRQLQILSYIKKYKKISRQEYAKRFQVSFMTAYRDLNKMAKLGLIQRKGSGKSTYYLYKPNSI